jgi:hypothetical protein
MVPGAMSFRGRIMTLRWTLSVALFAAVVVSVLDAGPGLSKGSVAIGLPSDVAKGGFAMGISHDYGSNGEADSESLKQCLSFMDAPDSTRALCKVYLNFENQCFAMSMDPEPGTPGFGYKVAATQSDADDGALTGCQNTAGNDRRTFCQVSYRICDGAAR